MTTQLTITTEPVLPPQDGTGEDRSPLQTALASFLTVLDGKNRSPLTVAAYRADLQQFFQWVQAHSHAPTPDRVERADITDFLGFLARQHLSGVTRARKLAALREFFRFLADRALIAKALTDGVETPKKAQ